MLTKIRLSVSICSLTTFTERNKGTRLVWCCQIAFKQGFRKSFDVELRAFNVSHEAMVMLQVPKARQYSQNASADTRSTDCSTMASTSSGTLKSLCIMAIKVFNSLRRLQLREKLTICTVHKTWSRRENKGNFNLLQPKLALCWQALEPRDGTVGPAARTPPARAIGKGFNV